MDDQSPGSKNEAAAFYIGGAAIGGQFYNNHIKTKRQVFSKNGTVRVVLPEYYVDGDVKTVLSPYTILYGKNKVVVELEKETEIDLIVK